MRIQCKATKRFLMNIEIEKFFEKLNYLLKTDVNIPIEVEVFCKNCRMTEVYRIYKDHYVHVKSYKNQKKIN